MCPVRRSTCLKVRHLIAGLHKSGARGAAPRAGGARRAAQRGDLPPAAGDAAGRRSLHETKRGDNPLEPQSKPG